MHGVLIQVNFCMGLLVIYCESCFCTATIAGINSLECKIRKEVVLFFILCGFLCL